ncbi:MAG: DUF421 domain-containing protein [Chloroflexota bacterium]|nr:DUF421 domain-containing protein [Chloroflexota bacterium]
MDEVLRAIGIYLILMVIFRLMGKRSLAETTPFDLVLLLIFSEALQSALVDEDDSVTAAITVILTLLVVNLGFTLLRQKSTQAERLIEGVPIVILENGVPSEDRMRRARVDEGDILAAARETQGIDQIADIRLAVLERSGTISIMPKQSQSGGG